MKPIHDCFLYGILDTGYTLPADMPRLLDHLLAGGVDVVQVRAKGVPVEAVRSMLHSVRAATREAGVPLIVNDHPELAMEADGVHVGQDDAPLANLLADTRYGLVGKSTHSPAQALAAAAEGAHYIGFGPLFPTPTKAGRPSIGLQDIAQVHTQLSIPIFCIGGIKRENLPEVIAAGAKRVVIVSGLLQAEDVRGYARDCRALLLA